ncbi:MAG: AraC family transcriptional regulator [Cyanobacteriota bacterium]|nr:AraC family transcriptional regulator [Cyanobacteriota bacterium]
MDTAAIPFLKLPGASLASTNTVDFGSVVGTFLPLQVHTWDHPVQDEPFLNHSGCVRLGDLTLLSTWGSAIEGEVEQTSDAQLVLPYPAGTNHFHIQRQRFSFRSSCLFIPAARTRFRLHCTACSGIILSFAPESLLPVAHAIAGPGFDGLALRSALERPSILDRRHDSRRDRCQRLLMEALAFAERSVAIAGEVNPILRLDDLIRRLIVMLLVPDLLDPVGPSAVAEEKPFLHASLVEWLLAHLDEPISLSDMEQRSHYSRRSLQVAFKERFGCGPMQWLRRQRLAKARALLERPGSCSSLMEVALACGYLTVASFSRDYLARYGERPSTQWRRLGQAP